MIKYSPEYIYIIRTKEFVTNDENVYKIGKTKRSDPFKRFNEYEEGYEIYMFIAVENSTRIEYLIITLFKTKYKRFKSLEYFKGDIVSMINDIFSLCTVYGNIQSFYSEPIDIIPETVKSSRKSSKNRFISVLFSIEKPLIKP